MSETTEIDTDALQIIVEQAEKQYDEIVEYNAHGNQEYFNAFENALDEAEAALDRSSES